MPHLGAKAAEIISLTVQTTDRVAPRTYLKNECVSSRGTLTRFVPASNCRGNAWQFPVRNNGCLPVRSGRTRCHRRFPPQPVNLSKVSLLHRKERDSPCPFPRCRAPNL